jgi:hypothetical protein
MRHVASPWVRVQAAASLRPRLHQPCRRGRRDPRHAENPRRKSHARPPAEIPGFRGPGSKPSTRGFTLDKAGRVVEGAEASRDVELGAHPDPLGDPPVSTSTQSPLPGTLLLSASPCSQDPHHETPPSNLIRRPSRRRTRPPCRSCTGGRRWHRRLSARLTRHPVRDRAATG